VHAWIPVAVQCTVSAVNRSRNFSHIMLHCQPADNKGPWIMRTIFVGSCGSGGHSSTARGAAQAATQHQPRHPLLLLMRLETA
jgi:hypothetical protein